MSRATDEAWAQVMAASPAVYTQRLRDATEGTARDVAREVVGDMPDVAKVFQETLEGGAPLLLEKITRTIQPFLARVAEIEDRVQHLEAYMGVMVSEAEQERGSGPGEEPVGQHPRDERKVAQIEREKGPPTPTQERESKNPWHRLVWALEDMGVETVTAERLADAISDSTGAGAESEQGAPAPDEWKPQAGDSSQRAILYREAARESDAPAPGEGDEGEVEPVAYAPKELLQMRWQYTASPVHRVAGGDFTIPLYSHETVQRLQRELKEAREANEANAVRVADLQRMEAENARLRDPGNWRPCIRGSAIELHPDSYGVKYVGPDHESPSVSDNAGSGASVGDKPPESEG